MKDFRETWKRRILDALEDMAAEQELELPADAADNLIPERPPRPELGDIGFPLFPFARIFRAAPPKLAAEVVERLRAAGLGDAGAAPGEAGDRNAGEGAAGVVAEGPYVNVFLDRTAYAEAVLRDLFARPADYGGGNRLRGRRIMVEFSSPNTNKPLHLGHLRNDAIGESISRLLKADGAEVRKVNLVNDRGVHICQSMLAYKRFGNGETPESTGKKSDHFVGDYYVRFHELAKERPAAKEEAAELLKKWEQGDEDVLALWERMNGWAIEGIKKTYERTGVSFDQIYFESRTYGAGRREVLKGLEKGVFYKDDEGAVWVDLESIDLDKKVLLRSDGTSLYVTQDIGTALVRYRDWPFDELIYVVGSEQKYHFTVLFHILRLLEAPFSDALYHLSYGMVNLPEGKMKSREGTVVDADDLIDRLRDMAKHEIYEKKREEIVGDLETTAERIAIGALHYYLLQVGPNKDMIFNPEESLSFQGNTGPYLQYMGARISSMLARLPQDQLPEPEQVDLTLLQAPDEWELVRLIGEFPERVSQAAEGLNPSLMTGYLYELSKTFSRYYHDHPIVVNEDERVRNARVVLTRALLQVLRNAFELVGIPFLETM
ncbi:MAG: arginine--tRNA ligase [Spirochaetaceae bacterium]